MVLTSSSIAILVLLPLVTFLGAKWLFQKDTQIEDRRRGAAKLAEIFTDTNTVNLKQAGATTLYIRGSRGDSNLKSIPVSELFLDEVDEMDQKQIWLALERLSGQVHKHVWASRHRPSRAMASTSST